MLSRFSIGRVSRSGRMLTHPFVLRTHLSVDHVEQVLHRPAIQVRQGVNTVPHSSELTFPWIMLSRFSIGRVSGSGRMRTHSSSSLTQSSSVFNISLLQNPKSTMMKNNPYTKCIDLLKQFKKIQVLLAVLQMWDVYPGSKFFQPGSRAKRYRIPKPDPQLSTFYPKIVTKPLGSGSFHQQAKILT